MRSHKPADSAANQGVNVSRWCDMGRSASARMTQHHSRKIPAASTTVGYTRTCPGDAPRLVLAQLCDWRLSMTPPATCVLVQVCRHHAAAVAEGCGNTSNFTCPYHSWTYGETHLPTQIILPDSHSCPYFMYVQSFIEWHWWHRPCPAYPIGICGGLGPSVSCVMPLSTF